MATYLRMELHGRACDATPEDVRIVPYDPPVHHPAIPALYATAFDDRPWDDDWDRFPGFDPKGVFVAVASEVDGLIGYVVSFRKQGHGYISVVAVVPEWRRRGVASALIGSAVGYLRSLGLKTIRIDVEQTNAPARRAYERAGFQVVNAFEG